MEIHQKKAGPDYHRLKTMVKRSSEQEIRIMNFEARNGNYERNAVVRGHQHVCPLNCHAQLRFEVEKGFHVNSS